MIERVGSQASKRRTERSDGLNPLGLRSGRSESSASQPRASRVIPPNPTRPARSHYWPERKNCTSFCACGKLITKNTNTFLGEGLEKLDNARPRSGFPRSRLELGHWEKG